MNSIQGLSFLLYPFDPYDIAVLWDGKRVVAKPIIGFALVDSYFKLRGKDIYLRHFREENNGTIPPDWAIEWLKKRTEKKSFKIDMRMSEIDKFILEGVIQKRKSQIEELLNRYQ